MVSPPSVSYNHGEVCRFKKVLYGFKQVSCASFMKFYDILTFLGFCPKHHDPALFLKCTTTSCILLSLYVYDIIIIGDDVDEILKSNLASRFEMKDLKSLITFRN